MDDQELCARVAYDALERALHICELSNPNPELRSQAARLVDFARDIPLWILGKGVPLSDTLIESVIAWSQPTRTAEFLVERFRAHGRPDLAERVQQAAIEYACGPQPAPGSGWY